MQIALLCASSRFIPLKSCDKVDLLGRVLGTTFYSKLPYSNSVSGRKKKHHVSRGRAVISSVLGRRKVIKKETINPDPDYRIPIVLLGAAGAFLYAENVAAAVPIGLLGLLLLVQEVKVGDEHKESGENAFVDGKNRWNCGGLILVYFKETQTKPEGQIHFFPVIFNGKQLYDVMVESCGSSKTSGPNSQGQSEPDKTLEVPEEKKLFHV